MAEREPEPDPRRFFGPDLVASQAMASVHQHVNGGNLRAALAELQDLLTAFPAFAPAYNALGWLYANPLERPHDAIACYRQALALDPSYPPVYFNLVVALNTLGHTGEIPALVARGLAVPGADRGKLLHQLGTMYELARDYPEAARCYSEAIDATLSNADLEGFASSLERCEAKAARAS
jgi:tetratricopeptide (TPR) repeat protein